MLDFLREDIRTVMARDPAARSRWEVVLCYPGLHALWAHRAAHWLWERRLFLAARLLSQAARLLTGIEIHPAAKIGRRLFIDHGMGVVIGETTEVGDDVTMYQGVTLGGTGKERGKRHPTIGNNVMLSAGAKVLGAITIGNNSKIGAGAVVIRPVPPDCTVVGVPGRVVRRRAAHPPGGVDLAHGDLPDPIQETLLALEQRVKAIQESLLMQGRYGERLEERREE